MTAPDAFALGVEIATALDAARIPNALRGAIALAAWGVPRATADVDLNVFVEDADLDRVLDVFDRDLGIDVDRAACRERHRRVGMFVLLSSRSMRIDVFTPSIAFS